MIAHKIINGLLGLRGEVMVSSPSGIYQPSKQNRLKVAAEIEAAEKFDFGELMLEPLTDEAASPSPWRQPKLPGAPPQGKWRVPKLTEDEFQFWAEGLVPLPAPLCWYEFVINKCRSGLLIKREDEHWKILRLDYTDQGVLLVDMYVVCTPGKGIQNGGIPISIDIDGQLVPNAREVFGGTVVKDLAPLVNLAIYFSLMLVSRTTEITREVVPQKLKQAQIKRGGTPLQDHRIVRIVPERFTRHEPNIGGQVRMSPRLHWRRSHTRKLQSGQVIVIARMLVGRAELGEVSHEYRIG